MASLLSPKSFQSAPALWNLKLFNWGYTLPDGLFGECTTKEIISFNTSHY